MARMGGATILAQGAGLVVAPILTRLYAPTQFGLFGVFLSIATILAAIPPLGYGEAIMAARSDEEADQLLAASLLGSVVLGLGMGAGACLIVALQTRQLIPLPLPIAIFLAPTIAGMAATLCLQIYLARLHDWRRSAQVTYVQAAGRAVFQIGFGLAGIGAIGLVLAETLMRLTTSSFALGVQAQRIRALWGHSWAALRATALRYWRFPAMRMPSSLINNIGVLIAAPVISATYGLTAAGFYVAMDQLLNAPLGFVNKTVGDVFAGHFSKAFRHDRHDAGRVLALTAGGLALAGAIPALILFFAGPQIFSLALGKQWVTSGRLAAVMAPVLYARFVALPISWTCSVANRPEMKLVFDFGQLACVLAAFFFARRTGLTFEHAIIVLSAALTTISVVLIGLSIYSYFRPRHDAHAVQVDA